MGESLCSGRWHLLYLFKCWFKFSDTSTFHSLSQFHQFNLFYEIVSPQQHGHHRPRVPPYVCYCDNMIEQRSSSTEELPAAPSHESITGILFYFWCFHKGVVVYECTGMQGRLDEHLCGKLKKKQTWINTAAAVSGMTQKMMWKCSEYICLSLYIYIYVHPLRNTNKNRTSNSIKCHTVYMDLHSLELQGIQFNWFTGSACCRPKLHVYLYVRVEKKSKLYSIIV